VEINKGFRGKYPHTICALSERGRRAFREYWVAWRKVMRDIEAFDT